MDAHRSQRWCPWFNSLFNFLDRGVKTDRQREHRRSVSPQHTADQTRVERNRQAKGCLGEQMHGWINSGACRGKQMKAVWRMGEAVSVSEWDPNTQFVRAGQGSTTWGHAGAVELRERPENQYGLRIKVMHPKFTVHFYAVLKRLDRRGFYYSY